MEAKYFTIIVVILSMHSRESAMCHNPEPSCTSPPNPSLKFVPRNQPWAPCLMHQTWSFEQFHIWWYTCFSYILSNHPTLAFIHRIQKSVVVVDVVVVVVVYFFNICVSFAALHIESLLASSQIPYVCGFFFSDSFFFFYCSELCHTMKWNSHGFTCVPHPDPPSHLLLDPIPLGFPSAPCPSTCLMHPTWAGDLFHPR